MALVSVAPLAVDVSHIKPSALNMSPPRPKFFGKPFPFPATFTTMQRRKVPCINMAQTKTEEAVIRRSGNYHPNLWDDNFIRSLSKTNQDPSYADRAQTLIMEIKEMFNIIPTSSLDDLFERISMVDNVERLGIQRHFQKEIKEAVEYIHRYWKQEGIGRGRESISADLSTTASAFRILRLQRYNVSSDVLGYFKGERGEFLTSATQSEEEIKSILNLFRASLIAFPGEKVMEEAKAFSTKYLKEALQKINSSSLSREIEFNLEYGWHTNLPLLEARNYIEIYGKDSSWINKTINNMPHMSNKKLLELAILDFNMAQSLQKGELQILSRWWVDSGLCKLKFARHRHVEYYFWPAGLCVEPKYSAFRLGFAKLTALATYIDDIYDFYGTLDELKLFTDAVKRWDASAADCLPEYMKIAYNAFYEAVNEMAEEAAKTQGRDTLDYARKAWEAYIDAYMKEAEWFVSGYIPTLDEYLANGKVSSGFRVVTLQPVLTLDVLLPENILPEFDYPSKFDELLGLTTRLRGDTRTFKHEAARGEVVSCVTCYMRDHPGSTVEEALNYLDALVEKRLKELNWEYLKADNVPTMSKDYAYNISRGLHLFYKERDGFSVSDKDTKQHLMGTMFEPLPLLLSST